MISSINFLTFLSIGWGLGNGTGLFDFTHGFGVGFESTCTRGFGVGLGATYFVGFRGSGNSLIVSHSNFDFDLFPLRGNFIFLFGTGESNNVFSNDLLTNLLIRFSITIYSVSIFFKIIKIRNNNFYNLMSELAAK